MRFTFLFCVLIGINSCGPKSIETTPTHDVANVGSAKPPEAGPSGGRDVWSAGIVPAWRVNGAVHDVIALDAERGLVLAGQKVQVVSFASGEVKAQTDFGSGSPALARTASGIVAFGNIGKASAAWTINASTMAVTPLTFEDPPVAGGTKGGFSFAVSPDGTFVLTCGEDHWPTLRDAASFTAVKIFTGVDKCQGPAFIDDKHAYVDRVDSSHAGRVLDLATGKTTMPRTGAAIVVPGPGKRSASMVGRKVTITDGGREVASYAASLYRPVWLADGSAIVSAVRGKLTVVPAVAGKTVQEFDLPASLRRITPIPGTTKLLFQAGSYRLGIMDAADGKVTSAEGTNLGNVEKIAVIDGTVVSGAERIRVWRDGAITASSRLATAEMIDVDAGQPALYATLDGVFTMELASGTVDAIDGDASSSAADRAGDRVLYDADDRVMERASSGGRARRWWKRSDDFYITDLDAATGRVAMTDDDAFYVAWPESDELFGFHSFDCEDPLYLYLERGKSRAAAYDGVTVHLYNTDTRKALGGIELTDDNIEALAFVPGTTELLLVGESLYIWDPVTHALASWPLPAEHADFGATTLAIDPGGTQVAVGFSDGAVLWAKLAYVRAHASPAGGGVATQPGPAALRCSGKKMAASMGEVRGPDDGDGDDDGDDGDEDDDSDD